jgi:hypothetical protein
MPTDSFYPIHVHLISSECGEYQTLCALHVGLGGGSSPTFHREFSNRFSCRVGRVNGFAEAV